MDLRQLKYFVAIAKHGSFSKAALYLRIAQPALSQHVRNMEEELGMPLFHRLSRGVTPTEAGERMLVKANAILSDFNALPDFVRGKEHAPAGPVHIGLPGTVSEILALPLIETALEAFPDVQIRVAEAMSGFVLEWLRRGEIDLAIIYSGANPAGVRTTPILNEQLHLFAAPSLAPAHLRPGQEIGIDEATAHDLILPSVTHGLRDLVNEAASRAGETIKTSIETDSYRQIKHLAARGLGFAILPENAIRPMLDAGELVSWPIRRADLGRQVYLAMSTERPLSSAARAIAQHSVNTIIALVEQGQWSAQLTAPQITLDFEADPS
ncbi:MAG: LysR substrate-binding domain-containing protein [Neomegalonema sp.]|nr:LysR substrate-binding domain-containing protein [Neomegalonema sp.]